MQSFSNIIAPLVAGLYFLLYFVYFIIVNIRVFILCAVIAPVIILGSNLFNRRRARGAGHLDPGYDI